MGVRGPVGRASSGVPWLGYEGKVPHPQNQQMTKLFVKTCYLGDFEPVLRCMHHYINQVNMKRKKNRLRGRNVACCLPTGHKECVGHSAQ